MSTPDDVPVEMDTPREPRLADTEADRLLAGRPLEGRPDLDALAELLDRTRTLSRSSVEPSPALAALLRDGLDPAATGRPVVDVPVFGAGTASRAVGWRRAGRLAGLTVAAKVALGSGVALAGVASAGAAGVLPGAVQDRVDSVVRSVNPFDQAPAQVTPVDRPEVVPVVPSAPASPSGPPSPAATRPTPAPAATTGTDRPLPSPAAEPAVTSPGRTGTRPSPFEERPAADPAPSRPPEASGRPSGRPESPAEQSGPRPDSSPEPGTPALAPAQPAPSSDDRSEVSPAA